MGTMAVHHPPSWADWRVLLLPLIMARRTVIKACICFELFQGYCHRRRETLNVLMKAILAFCLLQCTTNLNIELNKKNSQQRMEKAETMTSPIKKQTYQLFSIHSESEIISKSSLDFELVLMFRWLVLLLDDDDGSSVWDWLRG